MLHSEAFSKQAELWRLAKVVSISRPCRVYDSWRYVIRCYSQVREGTHGNFEERTRLGNALGYVRIAIVAALSAVVKRELPGVRRKWPNVLLIERWYTRASIPGLFDLVRPRTRGLVVIDRGPAVVDWEDGFGVGVKIQLQRRANGVKKPMAVGASLDTNVCVVIELDAHMNITAKVFPQLLPSTVSQGLKFSGSYWADASAA